MKPTELSKFLSYVLRHSPESIGIRLDVEGWVSIPDLISAATSHNHKVTMDEIIFVVKSSDKKRFTLSEDETLIRAAQGHSTTQVNISFRELKPPEFLYHGTATRFMESILKQGLLPMSRQYVHLSEEILTAVDVGRRYGDVALLKVNALKMYIDNFKFFQSENGVWLVGSVPVEYISAVKYNK